MEEFLSNIHDNAKKQTILSLMVFIHQKITLDFESKRMGLHSLCDELKKNSENGQSFEELKQKMPQKYTILSLFVFTH